MHPLQLQTMHASHDCSACLGMRALVVLLRSCLMLGAVQGADLKDERLSGKAGSPFSAQDVTQDRQQQQQQQPEMQQQHHCKYHSILDLRISGGSDVSGVTNSRAGASLASMQDSAMLIGPPHRRKGCSGVQDDVCGSSGEQINTLMLQDGPYILPQQQQEQPQQDSSSRPLNKFLPVTGEDARIGWLVSQKKEVNRGSSGLCATITEEGGRRSNSSEPALPTASAEGVASTADEVEVLVHQQSQLVADWRWHEVSINDLQTP